MPPKTIQATIAFTDPQNNVLANGLLTLDLFQAVEVTSGGGQVVPTRVALALDSTGKITGQPVNLWANDQLTPNNTVYIARLFNSNGLQVSGPLAWSIQGASPIDISQEVPVATTISFPNPVLLNPSSTQTITGKPLILTTSAPLTVQGAIALASTVTVGGSGVNGDVTFLGGTAGTVDISTDSLAVSLRTPRISPNSGTAYSGADAAIVPNAANGAGGWGVGATVTASAGFDGAFSFTITAAGTPGANPTTVVTFKNGSWLTAPQYLVKRNDTTAPLATGPDVTWATTASALTITFIGTPVAASTYKFVCFGLGN